MNFTNVSYSNTSFIIKFKDNPNVNLYIHTCFYTFIRNNLYNFADGTYLIFRDNTMY